MANFTPQKDNIPDVLAALREEFATSVNNIYINSLDKTYSFRDLTVLEQKTFSKLTIDHEDEPDFIYDTQCALIKRLCTDPEFDIYSITEFDRLKIFFLIYQSNFFNSPYSINCKNCDAQFNYTLDFDTLIKVIDNLNLQDINITHTIKNRKYDFIINFPTVRRMSDYKKYQTLQLKKNKHNKKHNSQADTYNTPIIDMIDLLIKKLTITNIDTGNIIEINPDSLKYADYMLYLETIPQNIIYSDTSPLLKVARDKFNEVKSSLPTVVCPECGENVDVIGDIDSFFI